MRTSHYQKEVPDFSQTVPVEPMGHLSHTYQAPIHQTPHHQAPAPQASLYQPSQSQLGPPIGSSSRELLDYYQNLAETYRKKFLDLEKEFYMTKQMAENESSRAKEIERACEDRTRHEIEQVEARHSA
jgi:hypothetical protein